MNTGFKEYVKNKFRVHEVLPKGAGLSSDTVQALNDAFQSTERDVQIQDSMTL